MNSDGSPAEDLLEMIETEEAYLSRFGVLDPWTMPEALRSRWPHGDQTLEESVEQLVGDGRLIWLRSFAEDGRPRLERDFARRRYRSRLAETFRLVSLARQRFPNRDFARSPDLVTGLFWYALPRYSPLNERSFSALQSNVAASMDFPELRQALGILSEAWDGEQLSGFQERAFHALVARIRLGHSPQLEAEPGPSTRGVVVQAPTGAGKTRAFFMPALLEPVIRRLESDVHERGCSVLAVYPRTALASDQLMAVLPLVQRLNEVLEQRDLDPITIGVAWTGQLHHWPPSPEGTRGWARHSGKGGGWRLLFLRCFRCGEPLYAPDKPSPPDLECLRCRKKFPEIKYLWEGYVQHPPDVLVAVAQTLHLRLSSTQYSAVFGSPGRRGPSLVLLDEVHLYGGLFGAQVASLVRRLRQRLAANDPAAVWAVFVGLSATLELAVSFFSKLTGIDPTEIEEIAPAPQELKRVGTEAVGFARSNRQPPVLATAIQSAMVVGHTYLRDAPDEATQERAFIFGDNIDLVHRLAFQLRDAEESQELFRLRVPGAGVEQQFRPPHSCSACDVGPDGDCHVFLTGECWWSTAQTREEPLTVSAVSSLSGESNRARITVATPSLEVGIDDRSVMSTIQYLSPPSPSNFVQRRGRAGRSPGTRPLSLLILSQLRPSDMFVFRNPSALVSPTLPPISMNPGNMLARRTHAFAGILDRFAVSNRFTGRFGLDTRVNGATLRSFAEWIADERDLARDIATLWDDTARGDAAIHRLLWSSGTGLLTRLLPHLLHRNSVDMTPLERLEDYLPRLLFSELKVPDFVVSLPWDGDERERREEIDIALATTLPGNVTYRYSQRGNLPLWIPRSPFPEDRCFDAELAYQLRDTGIVLRPDVFPHRILERVRSGPPNAPLPLVRPSGLRPGVLMPVKTQPRFGVRESDIWSVSPLQPPVRGVARGAWYLVDSRSFAICRHWVERDDQTGLPIDVLRVDANGMRRSLGGVQRLIPDVTAYLTGENGGLVSYRATIGGSSYGIVRKGRDTQHVVSEFGFVRKTNEGTEDVALGWSGRVDGLCFRFDVARARSLARRVLGRDRRLHNDVCWKILSREFLRRVEDSKGNIFEAERALEVVAAASVARPTAARDGPADFMEVVGAIRLDDDDWTHAAVRTWQDLHTTVVTTVGPEDDTGEEKVTDFPHQGDEVQRWFNDHAGSWSAAVEFMKNTQWVEARMADIMTHTIARMLRVAVLRNSGAADSRDFLADDGVEVKEITGDNEREIFVFETALEGAGLCQAVVDRLTEHPDAFGDQIATVAQQCPRSAEDEFLRGIVRFARSDARASDLLVAAETVHGIDVLGDLQCRYRGLFGEPLLDWQVRALRIRSPSLGERSGIVPAWWEISGDLVSLEDELAASCGFTPSVELLVWAAIRRSERDNSLPAVRALRTWLGERLSGGSLDSALASVLERLALRGCEDGCPDCVAGLPDEIDQSQRMANTLLSRSLAAAVIEECWTQESIAVVPDVAPGPDEIATWLLAACRRGESEASIVVERECMGTAIELLERATGTGMSIGLKTVPISIRAARQLSGRRVQLVVGLAE